MRYICVDIGTTTIKGIIYDELGRLVDEISQKSKLYTPNSFKREQNPDEILWDVRNVLRELVSKVHQSRHKVEAIALSCYMHSLVLLDGDGAPLTGIMLWNDLRAASVSEVYKENGIGLDIYKKTGTPIHPMSPFYKLLYYKEMERDIFERAKKFVGIKEIITKWMCGEYYVDYSVASSTGMFDICDLKWNKDALNILGVDESYFSTPVDSTFILPNLNESFLKDIGLDSDVKIVIGASDGCLANLGSHGLDHGVGVVTIGTSGAYRVVTDKPVLDTEARTFSYILTKGYYVSGGAINNGAIAYDFVLNNLKYDEHLDKIFKKLNPEDYGKGILFLPFLSGERAPYWDADLRSAFLGLNQTHTRKDILFSTIKGICYALRDVMGVIDDVIDSKISSVYVNGGFVRSEIWLQTLCNILNKPVLVSDNGDGVLFGAFLISLLATGKISSLKEAEKYFVVGREFLAKNTTLYDEEFSIYRKAISANRDILHDLSRLAD